MQIRFLWQISAAIASAAALFAPAQALAFANGDGSCSPTEALASDCAAFGGNTIEFTGVVDKICNWTSGSRPCTEYKYYYSGGTSNQVLVAIPKSVMTGITSSDASTAGCQQLITDGSGDSTTGFYAGSTSFNVCRVAANFGSATHFSIVVNPSAADPLAWQEKVAKAIYTNAVNGPSTPPRTVASTAETLTAADGTIISYHVTGSGAVVIDSCKKNGSDCVFAQVLGLDATALCYLNPGASATPFNISNYTCEPVKFVDGNPTFKAGDNSTCYKYIGSTPLAYSC